MRYEAYLPPLQGFDPRYEGSGIPYRYASYTSDFLDVTVGNFYEQFGSGMIFRSYEERQLGIDNVMDGIRLRFKPTEGITIVGLVGEQRAFFDKGGGLMRGIDFNVDFDELSESFAEGDWNLQIGASAISRFQRDNEPFYNLPENVSAIAGRVDIGYQKFSLYTEFAYKINDPSATDDYFFNGDGQQPNPNNFTFKSGSALYISASYAQKGLGISLNAKRIDKMDFRSDRTATGNNLTLSFLPALTKQHTYRLATLFPYATQPNGEIGIQADVVYSFPRTGSLKGTTVTANYSRIASLDTNQVNSFIYETEFPGFGDRVYFEDFSLEISNRWSKKFKSIFSYVNLTYDKDKIEGKSGYGQIFSHIIIGDLTYILSTEYSLRAEVQHIWSNQEEGVENIDKGNWVFGLLEFTIGSSWFITVSDEYNYGNPDSKKKLHFYNAGITFIKDAHRVALIFNRQREGIICVGGVCRNVPAASGLALSVTSTF